MIMPEVILFNTLTAFINLTAKDYKEADDKSDSIISQIFNLDDNNQRIIMADYDYYKQAVSILTRETDSQRKLHYNLGYNMQRMNVPCIHILMPNESKGRIDTIGHSEDLQVIDDKMWMTKTRSSSSNYYLMITSDNSSEVMVVYYWLKTMLLSFHETLETLGLRNLNHSGQDLNLQQEYAPNNVFHRNLSLSFDFEFNARLKVPMTIINSIRFSPCDDLSAHYQEYLSNLGG